MKVRTIIAAMTAAAAAKILKRRDERLAAEKSVQHTYLLKDDEARISQSDEAYVVNTAKQPDNEEYDGPGDVIHSKEIDAVVLESNRAMDPLTLQGASRVTMECGDGKKRKYFIPGKTGAFILKGDRGVLTFSGSTFVSFEKENGEFVSPLFHTAPDGRKV